MALPLFGIWFDFNEALVRDDDPFDHYHAQVVVNNAVAAWEQSGQCRVNFWSTPGVLQGTPVANQWARILQVEFPCSLMPTRAPWPFRVRLAGKAGTGGVTTDYRVGIGATSLLGFYLLAGSPVLSGTTTSATLSWVIEDTLQPSIADGERSMRDMFTSIEAGAGKPGTAQVCMLGLEVWGRTSNVSHPARVHGLIAEEWMGEDLFGSVVSGGGGADEMMAP